MRRMLLLTALLLAATACGSDSEQNPAVERSDYVPASIEFWDAAHGAVVLVKAGCDDCRLVEETGDGGRTWRRRDYERGPQDPRERGFPMLPSGREWREVVDIVDSRSAWVVHWRGDRFLGLERTADGGRSWIDVENPCRPPYEVHFAPLSAPTPTRAWLLCQGGLARSPSGGSGDGKALYSTTDGGKTWRLRASAPPPGGRRAGRGLPVPGRVETMSFSAGGLGVFASVDTPFSLSGDGGATWRRPRLPRKGYVGDVQAASRDVAYALVRDEEDLTRVRTTRLFRTADRGRTWTQVRTWIFEPGDE